MCDSEALLQAVRCLGMLEVRSFKIGVVCDSEALLQAVRCLGMLGERSFKIGVVMSDRCLGMLEVRSFKIGVVRSLFWGCDRLKLGLCAIAKRCCKQFAIWGSWESDRLKLGLCAIAKRSVGIAVWE